MISARLLRLHSPDVRDLGSYVPEDRRRFGFLVQLMAGPSDSEGEESFDFILCSPEWLAQELRPNDVLIGRHHLIVREYNYGAVLRFLEDYCKQCVGNTWEEVALQLGRLGKWEFEDYQA